MLTVTLSASGLAPYYTQEATIHLATGFVSLLAQTVPEL